MSKAIVLEHMHIENFKGISSMDIAFSDTETDIYGDNATGKTTIYDGFTWLIFGKDSRNSAQFQIKPLNSEGDVANHGAITAVQADITVDGRTYELRKEYREEWKKKRGSQTKVLDGHETKRYIDGIPKTQTEYNAFIKELINEERFRQLTSPEYFASIMDWKKRRSELLEMAGDITTDEVLAANPELENIRELLERHSQADLLKKLKADRARVNKSRAELPVRIDEAMKSIGGQDIDVEAEQAEIERLDARIAEEAAKVAALRSGENAAQIAEITKQIVSLREEAQEAVRIEMDAYREKVDEYDNTRRCIEKQIGDAKVQIAKLEASIAAASERVEVMRTDYRNVNAKSWDGDERCPTCGQELPADMLAEKKEAFNIEKSSRLEELAQTGKSLNDQISKAKAKIAALTKAIQSQEAELEALVKPEKPEIRHEDTPEIEALIEQRKRIENGDEAARKQKLDEVNREIARLREQANEHAANISEVKAAEATEKRIRKLKADEKKLGAEIERLDALIDSCEQFVRTKVDIMETRINGMFRIVSWTLFKEQLNGGLDECCELTAGGVPYSDLNSAMRINAGIDVINTLSRHYEITAPVFIDNAETVTALEGLDGQLIRLVVSEQDKVLRIEEPGITDGIVEVA